MKARALLVCLFCSHIEHTAGTASCHAGNGVLSSVKLLTRKTESVVIKTPCTFGLNIVLFHRCMRACELCPETCVFGEDLRQLPLAGIAPERTHGPEGVGRVYPYGLGGFLHFGLDVRVDLRG